jgi:soluble lytic murein transglycosylase-like protein
MHVLFSLIVSIATAYDIPPYFMAAIAEVESDWDVNATHINNNGTIDYGLMQLNSSWFNDPQWNDPEVNITAAAKHIAELRLKKLSWWQVAIAYNCGFYRLSDPPAKSIDYAVAIYDVWQRYDKHFITYIGR